MLEQIIIRKSFLKKHLAAPLLKEREYFLTMKSKEGLSRLTLLGWAGIRSSLSNISIFMMAKRELCHLMMSLKLHVNGLHPFLIIIILGNVMIALPQESNSLRWLLNSYYT